MIVYSPRLPVSVGNMSVGDMSV